MKSSRDERLRVVLASLREHADEDERQAKEAGSGRNDEQRAAMLRGGAEALRYAVKRIEEVL